MGLTTVEASHRLRDGSGYFVREAGPMLLILALPAALVLVIAFSVLPGAQSSPSPMAERDAGFHYETIGVGVKQLVHDGAGHRPGQRLFLFKPDRELIAFEPDGSVLLCCGDTGLLSDDVLQTELYRLGDEEPVLRWNDDALQIDQASDMAVAPDGTVWAAGRRLYAFDGEGWTVRRGTGDVFESGRMARIWADVPGKSLKIARFRGGAQRDFAPGRGLPPVTARWDPMITGIAATPDGSAWVGVGAERVGRPGGLLRFEDGRWTVVRPLGRGIDARVEGVTAAPDGTLWVYLSRDARKAATQQRPSAYLARFDGRRWTVFSEDGGVPYHGALYARDADRVLMEAGPYETVWLTPLARDGCRRLISFRDGIATSHLDEAACIEELEIAPDGTAWVVVEWSEHRGAEHRSTGLYLVKPPR